jgi:hypothetical protein
MNDNILRIDNFSDGLLVLTNSISDLYNQLSGIKSNSIAEGKIIILSMINQIIVQDNIDSDSQKIFDSLKNKFIQSLSLAELSTIRIHTYSVIDFLDQRIWLYNYELNNIIETEGKIHTLASYCIYVDPLGFIDFNLRENEVDFYNKYHCENLEALAMLNFLNNSIYNDIKRIIIRVFNQF